MIHAYCKYKKDYIRNFGIIPTDYEIHHIDGNRKNNDLKNLVAIPFLLHKRYHQNEKEMIKCFNVKNEIGFKYHRDMMIMYYYKIMDFTDC